jgi:putative two-component system response regulator
MIEGRTMPEQDTILVVDDDEAMLQLLTDILSDQGFQVWPVNSGESALKAVRTGTPKLILLDINMPGMDGFEVCMRLKAVKESHDIPIIFVSGIQNHRERLKGFSLGAVDFISKPFQSDELLARVGTHLELNRLRAGLEATVAERTAELLRSFEQMRKVLGATVQAIASLVETRDPYTAGHQRRVAELAYAIGKEMGLPRDQVEGLRTASAIHDIGKISVPAEILSMPRTLTGLEFSLIKTHPQSGYDILRDIAFPRPIARMILEHHERMDGSGYPNGLKGSEILLETRILSVADVVESMASHRPYRPALGLDQALEEITMNRGLLYDAEIVEACLRLFREKNYRFD